MSADNWTTCPRCFATELKRVESVMEKAKSSYGKVKAEEYAALQAEAVKPMNVQNTLREDYELGLYGGEFQIDYACSCSECGFSFNFKHSEKVKL